MSVKASVSITEQQDTYVRRLVEEGQYSSLSAVVQRGLELVREEAEFKKAELAALKALVEGRMEGEFVGHAEGCAQTQEMLARKRDGFGL